MHISKVVPGKSCETDCKETNHISDEHDNMYYKYLMSVDKNRTHRIIAICIENVFHGVVFGLVAHAFDKWWIILFGLLAMSTYNFDKK